jgi:hypothetical protein
MENCRRIYLGQAEYIYINDNIYIKNESHPMTNGNKIIFAIFGNNIRMRHITPM